MLLCLISETDQAPGLYTSCFLPTSTHFITHRESSSQPVSPGGSQYRGSGPSADFFYQLDTLILFSCSSWWKSRSSMHPSFPQALTTGGGRKREIMISPLSMCRTLLTLEGHSVCLLRWPQRLPVCSGSRMSIALVGQVWLADGEANPGLAKGSLAPKLSP